jgi:hypothetical protein
MKLNVHIWLRAPDSTSNMVNKPLPKTPSFLIPLSAKERRMHNIPKTATKALYSSFPVNFHALRKKLASLGLQASTCF